jgi:hypothetical protein
MLQEWIDQQVEALDYMPRGHSLCPLCQQGDRSEKVSSLVRRHSGTLYLPDSYEEVTFTTGLGRSLSLPGLPQPVSFEWLLSNSALSWMVTALGILLVVTLQTQNLFALPEAPLSAALVAIALWFGLVTPALLYRRYHDETSQVRSELPAWRLAKERWDHLYYCARDDVVYLKDGGPALPPEDMPRLLQVRPFVSDLWVAR